MKTLKILITVALMTGPAVCQSRSARTSESKPSIRYRVACERVPYIGGNRLYGSPPNGYENLLTLWVDVKTSRGYRGDYARLLIPNEDGQIPVAGRIVFRGRESKYQSFEFSVATLIEKPEQPIVLIFTTETKQGVNYVFEGHYSEDFTEKSSTTKPSLEGVIRKFFKGRELSKTVLRFIPFTILE